MSANVIIQAAGSGDAQSIAAIYNYYIINSVVTFEETEVTANEMAERIAETAGENLPYLVAKRGDDVIGYAYASKWKGRCAYRFTAEITVYLAPEQTGGGTGSALYRSLFDQLSALNYHMVIGGISLPNEGSIGLHEKFGMQKVAHFQEVGFKFEQWVDVGYWQGPLTHR